MDRINVIIAHKNYNNYLKDAINSCNNQTIKVNYTIIDDNSKLKPFSDEELSTWEKQGDVYKKDGNRIIFLPQSFGPSTARNIGITSSWEDSDFFMILDADDIMLPNKCEKLLEVMDENVGVSYADYYIQDVESSLLKMEYKTPFSRNILEQECIVHSNSLISKKALWETKEGNNFYDPRLLTCEDYDLWLRISERFLIRHVPEFLSLVRNHNQSSVYYRNENVWNQCYNLVHQKKHMRNARS